MADYVCGAHQDIPVDYKGKGCGKCQSEHEKRMAKKELQRKRRAAWLRGEKFEEEQEDNYSSWNGD